MSPGMTMLLLFVLLLAFELLQNPGYRCPACGTSSAREHSEDCSWSKHYGDEL